MVKSLIHRPLACLLGGAGTWRLARVLANRPLPPEGPLLEGPLLEEPLLEEPLDEPLLAEPLDEPPLMPAPPDGPDAAVDIAGRLRATRTAVPAVAAHAQREARPRREGSRREAVNLAVRNIQGCSRSGPASA